MTTSDKHPLAALRPIMARCQSTLSEEEFHAAVNVTFHKYESECYDEVHRNMWESLPRQFSLLAEDALAETTVPAAKSLRLLDIGCGTGLATDCLLRTRLGEGVASITLLDTSEAMLKKATARARSWNRQVEVVEGLLEKAPLDRPFDIIITSSVLHHVPDLPAFFREVSRRQEAGGIFLHVQDPHGDSLSSPTLAARRKKLESGQPDWLSRLHPKRILGRIERELSGTQGDNVENRAIRELVSKGITPRALTINELYRITDFHVADEVGISIRNMQRELPQYHLIRSRAYGFYGLLEADLDERRKRQELEWIAAGAQDGFHVGAIWRRI